METLFRILSILLLLMGIAAFASADNSLSPDSVFGSHPKVLRFGVHVSGIGNFDPHLAAGSQDRAVADMLFNGLLRYEPGNAPRLEPDLAASIPKFELIGGKQVWTVRLRKGVMFHSGPKTPAYELTAEDVVFSFHKSADKNHSSYAGAYDGMRFVSINRYTISIFVDKPVSSILFLPKLTNYAGGFIVSKRAIEAMGYDHYGKHPVGTGPFRFDDYDVGKKLLLPAHDEYFRGAPLLDGVEIRFFPDIHNREAALLSGELDVITGSGDNLWIEKMSKKSGVVIDTHGVGEVITLYLNTLLKPLDDSRVRQAIAFALDRKGFLDTANQELVAPVFSPVPTEFLPGGLTRSQAEELHLTYDTNIAKAKKLMAEAGFPDGFSLDLISSEKRLYLSCYQKMREQLSQIGIDCRIRVETHSTMHKCIRNSDLPLVIYVAWRPNADSFLSRFFHSNAIVISGSKPDTNFSRYSQIDGLIEEARLQIDPTKQIQLWKHAQIRILNDMVAFPIMSMKQCYARRAAVDYGHPLVSTVALYPQFTEKTRLTVEP